MQGAVSDYPARILTHWPLGDWNEILVICVLNLVIDGWCISGKIALRWKSLDLSDDKSTLVPVMAWCRQATSHYLSQCWPRSLSPYDVTRPQWVKDSQQRNKLCQTVFLHRNPEIHDGHECLLAISQCHWPECCGWEDNLSVSGDTDRQSVRMGRSL